MRKIVSLILVFALVLSIVNVGGTAAVAAGKTEVTIHYKPSPTSTDDWNMWLWEEGKEGKAYAFTGSDAFGKVLKVTFPTAITKLGFIVRTDAWKKDVEKDRFVTISGGKAEIWLLTGDPEIYKSVPDNAPKLFSASFVNSKTIELAMTVPLKSTGKEMPLFTVKEGSRVTALDNVRPFGKDAAGNATRWLIQLKSDMRFGKTYSIAVKGYKNTLEVNGRGLYGSEGFNALYEYKGSDLGATYTKKATAFRVWAPTADQVKVTGYADGTSGKIKFERAMTKSVKGTWTASVSGDQAGLAYTYRVMVDGVWNEEAVDPYARAVTVNGERGVVVDLSRTNPANFQPLKKPAFKNATDAIIYELHVRDFSNASSSGMKNKGKYLAFTELNTKGPNGTKTGISYLKDLGVTHVQLLPVFDYNSVDERNLKTPQFNWGYDPKNYNAPEGSYSTNPANPTARIVELKQAIQAMHNNGLRVIMDVVYNHMFNADASNLGLLVPGYYYRYSDGDSLANGTGVGNETASDHAMMRKLIVDSVVYWAKEYGMDGFRFDLMGIHDVATMNAVRAALNKIDPSIVVIGEGWSMGNVLAEESKANQSNAALLPGIGQFNDAIRDGLKGSVFNKAEGGWLNQLIRRADAVGGVVGGVKYSATIGQFAVSPAQSVNYVEAHDNNTLWDKLGFTNPKASEAEKMRLQKMAGAFVLTSQGISFLHAGQEFLRTKGGDENSYKSSDAVNQLDWARKAKYQKVVDYYKGLIALRKAHPAFRMTSAAQVKKAISFIKTSNDVIAYTIGNKANGDKWAKIAVIHNAGKSAKTVKLPSKGTWRVVVNGDKAGTAVLGKVSGDSVKVGGQTTFVLYQ
jgi:pullulanase